VDGWRQSRNDREAAVGTKCRCGLYRFDLTPFLATVLPGAVTYWKCREQLFWPSFTDRPERAEARRRAPPCHTHPTTRRCARLVGGTSGRAHPQTGNAPSRPREGWEQRALPASRTDETTEDNVGAEDSPETARRGWAHWFCGCCIRAWQFTKRFHPRRVEPQALGPGSVIDCRQMAKIFRELFEIPCFCTFICSGCITNQYRLETGHPALWLCFYSFKSSPALQVKCWDFLDVLRIPPSPRVFAVVSSIVWFLVVELSSCFGERLYSNNLTPFCS
jgi:hypothetical protein